MSFSQQVSQGKSFHLTPRSKNCQFATSQCYAERSRITEMKAYDNPMTIWPQFTKWVTFAIKARKIRCALQRKIVLLEPNWAAFAIPTGSCFYVRKLSKCAQLPKSGFALGRVSNKLVFICSLRECQKLHMNGNWVSKAWIPWKLISF